jgi:hypothetical protein
VAGGTVRGEERPPEASGFARLAPAAWLGLHAGMSSLSSRRTVWCLAVAVAAAACGDDGGSGDPDARGADAAVPAVDARPADAGLDGGPDDWWPAVETLGNSGARFGAAGVALGGGGALRSTFPVTARGATAPLAIVGNAVAVRGAGTDVFVEVRNNGEEVRCFVELADLETRDGTGALVGDGAGSFSFIAGSIRETTGSVTTESCLGAGESAWAIYTTALTVEQTQAISRATVSLRSESAAYTTPPAQLVPTRQQLRPAGLAVELINRGTAAATFGGARWIGFDADGVPVGWTLLTVESFEPGAPIAAGGKVIAVPYPRPIDDSITSPVRGVVASSIVRVEYKSE